MTRKRKTEARKKRKLKELDRKQPLQKEKLEKVTGGAEVNLKPAGSF